MEQKRDKDETLCVVLGGGRGARLYPLTRSRSKPAVPFGGKYRIIDVPISNCLNSGLNKIFVLTQFQSASLNQHVRNAYVFDRFNGGFVDILAAEQTADDENWYIGTADAVRQNLGHLAGRWRDVLILSGDQLYHMDFRKLIDNHRRSGAPMSIAVLPVSAESAPRFGILKVNDAGRVVAFREKPPASELSGLETDASLFDRFGISGEGRPYLASMGIYLFDREILFRELSEKRHVDFGRDLFPSCVREYFLNAFLFDGYWEDIGTVKSFHEANLLLGKSPPLYSFGDDSGLTYTRPRTLPVTTAERLVARESIIAEGCRIASADVDESIVGIRSIIGKNVRLKRTMVMGADFYESEYDKAENRRIGRPNIGIGDDVVIENAIIDKDARIGSNVTIHSPAEVSPQTGDAYAVRDGVICIFKGAIIPSGTRIGG